MKLLNNIFNKGRRVARMRQAVTAAEDVGLPLQDYLLPQYTTVPDNIFKLKGEFTHQGGHCYSSGIDGAWELLQTLGPSIANGGKLFSIVYENGKQIGVGDSTHADIRTFGMGKQSLWGTEIYFSSSDNTDCRTNGRIYSVQLLECDEKSDLYKFLAGQIAANAERTLKIFRANWGMNNSVFNNSIENYRDIESRFQRYGVPIPRRVMEIGCGFQPFTALRFLADGASVCYVNDFDPVNSTFSRELIEGISYIIDKIEPSAPNYLLERTRETSEGLLEFDDLKNFGAMPFEEVVFPEKVEFIYSTAVFEHIMKPVEVIDRTWELLEDGGYALHVIDLRDHEDFSRPLEFLKIPEGQYRPKTYLNRLRSSQWKMLFEQRGFQVLEYEHISLKRPNSDEIVNSIGGPGSIWVTEEARSEMQPPFNRMTLGDLSTISFNVFVRKPAKSRPL